jgi:hypothetical protein
MMDHFMSNGMIMIWGMDQIPLRSANQCAADIAAHKARGDFAIACDSGLSVPMTEEALPPGGPCSGREFDCSVKPPPNLYGVGG